MGKREDSGNYSIDLLNTEDKETAKALNGLCEVLFDKETLDDYIQQYVESSNGGAMVKELLSGVIRPFAAYLQSIAEYYQCNFIIDKIDSYTDEEYEYLRANAEKLLNESESGNNG